jgi:NAD(P)-dependent dehydrogenase (short-subunit alcohol dehydrogenase family)
MGETMEVGKVWLITGASSGIGRALAEEALSRGQVVVATARRPEVLDYLVARVPESAVVAKLDVTNKLEVDSVVSRFSSELGRLDVVVNNAGYGLVGAVEEPSDEQIRQQFETNLFGCLNVIRAVLPTMREQRSGHIINVSSSLGFFAVPSYGYYSATKFALQGISEALVQELAPLGIRVTIAEPGGTRTDFVSRGIVEPANRLPDVYPSTAVVLDYMTGTDGTQENDPGKIATILVDTVELDEAPLHLPLGHDAITGIEGQLAKIGSEIDAGRAVSTATAF